VIVIGLENMFRLINAVLATPAEQTSIKRVSSALGEVGFLSLVAVATELGFLSLIATISVPAVQEFCAFAGIALIMDFVWHNTFFLAVLSVDVQRMELQDSLDRLMSLSSNEDDNDFQSLDATDKKPSPVADFLFKGGSPLGTRIAGSAIVSKAPRYPPALPTVSHNSPDDLLRGCLEHSFPRQSTPTSVANDACRHSAAPQQILQT